MADNSSSVYVVSSASNAVALRKAASSSVEAISHSWDGVGPHWGHQRLTGHLSGSGWRRESPSPTLPETRGGYTCSGVRSVRVLRVVIPENRDDVGFLGL